MTYEELIEKLLPFADKEVYFVGRDNGEDTEVVFSDAHGDYILSLQRRWGRDDVKCIDL